MKIKNKITNYCITCKDKELTSDRMFKIHYNKGHDIRTTGLLSVPKTTFNKTTGKREKTLGVALTNSNKNGEVIVYL